MGGNALKEYGVTRLNTKIVDFYVTWESKE